MLMKVLVGLATNSLANRVTIGLEYLGCKAVDRREGGWGLSGF